jgi:hypothetical protein
MTGEKRRQIRKNIADDVLSGMTIKELCKKYKVSMHQVHMACKEHGVQPPLHIKLQASTYSVIADLINTNKSFSQIGREKYITRQRVEQVYHRCKETGIPVKSRSKSRKA